MLTRHGALNEGAGRNIFTQIVKHPYPGHSASTNGEQILALVFQSGIPDDVSRLRLRNSSHLYANDGLFAFRIRFLIAAAVAITALLSCSQGIAAVPALCAAAPNQAAGTVCAAGKLRTAESALAQAYATLDAKLNPLGKRNLKLAQAAWLGFRDLECNLETGHDPDRLGEDGTIMPMMLSECTTALTEQRTRDLAGQAKCPDGDLSCEP